jgi:hypothetical protein
MKTSNKLLIVLLVTVLLAVTGSNMALKAEYEKIDFKNPYHGYVQETLPPFKILRLQGSYASLAQIQQGKESQIRIRGWEKESVKWQMRGDTLVVTYNTGNGPFFYRAGDAFASAPIVFITAPSLSGVYSMGATCKLTGWQGANLILRQEGKKTGMLLENSTLGTLSAVSTGGGLLQMGAANRIGNAVIQASDSSSFVAGKAAFGSIRISADSTAQVTLTGDLYNKLIQ